MVTSFLPEDADQVFELDEYAELVREIRQSGLIGDHRYHLRTYKNCLVGSELVDWMVASKNMSEFVLLFFSFFFNKKELLHMYAWFFSFCTVTIPSIFATTHAVV